MELKITTKIERSVLEGVFITALEGGSNYWYWLSDEAMELVDAAVPRDGKKATSERIFEAVFDEGIVIPINDVEDPEEKIGELNRENFQKRLQKCSEQNAWAIQAEIAEKGDAESSDIIFQHLCLGEVVYG